MIPRLRRVSRLATLAALAGLVAVVTVVVEKRYVAVSQQDPAAFLRSVADEPLAEAAPEEVITPDAALVADDVLTVHGGAICSGGTRAEVTEHDDEVSVRVRAYELLDPDPSDGVMTGCIPEGRPTAALVELDRPLGERLLVDAETGDPIPTMDAADVLRPAYLPPGWQHTRTPDVDAADGVITEVKTYYADAGHSQQLSLSQAPGAAGPTPMSVSYVPLHDYHDITWGQDGNGMRLSGHADDQSTVLAIARSVG